MENVVPGALQRLRAADIVRMAGLTAASQGQEFYRNGLVHATQRQEARLSGIVRVQSATPVASNEVDSTGSGTLKEYDVAIEVKSANTWVSHCPCSPNTALPCAHAAAVLYQWLARPASFVRVAPSAAPRPFTEVDHLTGTTPASRVAPAGPGAKAVVQRGPAPLTGLQDILGQIGLSELRTIAREHELPTNGQTKQQLVQAIYESLNNPEQVRLVAATLEKPQRQLLAALTLVGGSLADEELRGMFDRFALGQPNQLQHTLLSLQNKGLLFRTSLNSSPPQRTGLSGALLDIGWNVPAEVRTALRVTVPVTPYDLQRHLETPEEETPLVQEAAPYQILADLLLAARALTGYQLTTADDWSTTSSNPRSADIGPLPRTTGSLTGDGSVQLPPPHDLPSPSLLSALHKTVERPPALLRFLVRMLRLADILHRDEGGKSYLNALPNTAPLLLGPAHTQTLHRLFELWLTQSSYDELFSLQEDGLRLRCRSMSLNVPILRPGELDAENSEARQFIVALLAQAPLNQWISFTAFARFVYRLNPAFLQKRQRLFSSPHWWIEYESGRPLRPLQLNDWLRAEIYYLARLISGPLHWWGACDTVRAPEGRLIAFRLTPLADWLFNGVPVATETTTHNYQQLSKTLQVVDREELHAACALQAWPVIDLLEMFAEIAGVSQNHLRYRLTPQAMSKALSSGQRSQRLVELIRNLVADRPEQPFAFALLEQLERWIAGYGRVRIYTGVTLLETADTVAMRELAATTSLNEQVVRSLHPTMLLLQRSGAERLIDELKRRGSSPLVHEEELYGTE